MNDVPPPLHPAAPQPHYQPQAQPQAAFQPPPRKSGCGCTGAGCGVGCLLAVIASVAIVVFLGIAGMRWFEAKVEQYTAYESVPIETPQATNEEIAVALSKVQAFRAGMEEGGTPVRLELTGEELNLALWNDPEFSQMAGKANVDIVGDQLNAKVSLPLDDLPLPAGPLGDKLKGKFLNGEAGVKVGMAAGRPTLYLESLSVNGATVPEMFMSGMKSQNLLEEAIKKPEFKAAFDKIEDIRVEGGRLIVVPKASP